MRLSLLLSLTLSLGCASAAESSPDRTPSSGPNLASKSSCGSGVLNSEKFSFSTQGWKTDFCRHSVPYNEIRSGGPPRDGIPPIDNPKFVSVSTADTWLRDVEPILALAINGEAKAYPLQILIWHEIVNDSLGGENIVVTFCPLCYAALVFERPAVDAKVLSFGTSGNLRNSDLIMWDRQTESWWQQFTGEAIVGRMLGDSLTALPASIVSWASFKAAYPEASVLSRDTGNPRAYGKNPYAGYDDISAKPFLFQGRSSKRFPPMAHVVGVRIGEKARAYPMDALKDVRVISDKISNTALVLFYKPGTASALDATIISESKNVGTVGVFSPNLHGRRLHFLADAEGIFDVETKSQWSIMGKAAAGPLKGRSLRPLPHHRVFWFAWAAFASQDGDVYSAGSSSSQSWQLPKR